MFRCLFGGMFNVSFVLKSFLWDVWFSLGFRRVWGCLFLALRAFLWDV